MDVGSIFNDDDLTLYLNGERFINSMMITFETADLALRKHLCQILLSLIHTPVFRPLDRMECYKRLLGRAQKFNVRLDSTTPEEAERKCCVMLREFKNCLKEMSGNEFAQQRKVINIFNQLIMISLCMPVLIATLKH